MLYNVILIWLCLSSSIFGQNDKQKLEDGKSSIKNLKEDKTIDETKSKMEQAGVLQTTPDSKKAEAKLAQGKLDLTTAFDGAKFTIENGGELAKAVGTGVSTGLGNLVKGFQTKQPYYILSGVLNIMISLTTVMGPYGAIAGPILSIFSAVLDIFGKPAEEGQEGMLRRVLDDMAVKNLQDEAAGMEMFYSTLQSQVKIMKNNAGDVKKADLDPIYIVSYENFPVFGKIGNKIKSECFPGVFKSDGITNEQSSKVDRCLSLLKIYCKLSLIRQMFLAQLAGIAKDKNLEFLSESLLNLVSEAQKTDQDVLKFLTRPLDNPSARYTMYRLFSAQEEHPIVTSYVKKLDQKEKFDVELRKDVQIEVEFEKNYAMICNDLYLLGTCRLLKKTASPLAEPKHWGLITKSIFVPPKLQVRGKLAANILDKLSKSNDGTDYLGPIHGLVALSDKDLSSVKGLHVFDETIGDVDQMVTICRGTGINIWCQKVEEFSSEQKLNGLGGRDFSTLSSLRIPDGWEVTLVGTGVSIGPMYGHQVMDGFCQKSWVSIIAKKATIKGATSANKVIVCEKENFRGYCQQLGDEFLSNDPENALEFSKATPAENQKASCGLKNVVSIKVPALYSLYLYGNKDILNGPWSGPVEIKNVGYEGGIKKAAIVPNIMSKINRRSKIHRRRKVKHLIPKQENEDFVN